MARTIDGSRVQLIFPCGDDALYFAANRIIVELLREEETIQRWGGMTYSAPDSPVFTGLFWRAGVAGGRGTWEVDHNAVVVVDAPRVSLDEALTYFESLGARINGFYEDAGKRQDALWITGHHVEIIDFD